jgi:hypothetical protein
LDVKISIQFNSSPTTLHEFWLAQLFLSIASSFAPSVSKIKISGYILLRLGVFCSEVTEDQLILNAYGMEIYILQNIFEKNRNDTDIMNSEK